MARASAIAVASVCRQPFACLQISLCALGHGIGAVGLGLGVGGDEIDRLGGVATQRGAQGNNEAIESLAGRAEARARQRGGTDGKFLPSCLQLIDDNRTGQPRCNLGHQRRPGTRHQQPEQDAGAELKTLHRRMFNIIPTMPTVSSWQSV